MIRKKKTKSSRCDVCGGISFTTCILYNTCSCRSRWYKRKLRHDINKMRVLYLSGLSQREVGERMNTSKSTVSRYLTKYGYKID